MDPIPQKDYHAPMHTAEHILNQTMVRMFGCERSFSNHIERKKSKCDYHFPKALSANDISEIEKTVNAIINQKLEITKETLSFEDAKELYNLKTIPDAESPIVKIVHIGDYDSCPCIGEHVANTDEIGVFKITTTDFKDGVLRIRYKLSSN